MSPIPPIATSVALTAAHGTSIGMPHDATAIVCEGWVLKKRRKKMQGFARRYFTLTENGVLSYSFEPRQPPRDQLLLFRAAIATAPGRKDIHIDADTVTFHIKCLSTYDFDKWMAALRKFVAQASEARRSMSTRLGPSVNSSVNINRSGVIVDQIGATIEQLDEALLALRQEATAPKKSHHSKDKSKLEKPKEHKEGSSSVFGLFRKPSYQNLTPPNADGAQPPRQSTPSRPVSIEVAPSAIDRIEIVIRQLQSQHTALAKSMQELLLHDPSTSALAATAEEREPNRHSRQPSWMRPASVMTMTSDGGSEWFDASDGIADGPHEFVVQTLDSPDGEQPSRLISNSSQDSLVLEADTIDDTDSDSESIVSPVAASTDLSAIKRRTSLPISQPQDEGSLFSLLKKNVGKDLSTISFPVTFNEPLTLLQRAAEEMEYYDLLNQAAATKDPVERISLVAAFAVSSYAHTRHRSGRKGFNPLLAETFEDVRMRFIAEKVSHQPLIVAQHAEGQGWKLNATTNGKTKFWGKSLEIIPLGITRVQIGQDVFRWTKPSSFVRNLMVGNKYLEHVGKLTIENTTDGTICTLDFKQSGYWGPSNLVSGIVTSPKGSTLAELEGKWDENFAQKLDSSTLRVLWRAAPFPKMFQEQYGFTQFAMTLNEITPDLKGKLPPTDSRLRPDVRALEEGRLDDAESSKLEIEEMQRERRRAGANAEPRWFRYAEADDDWEYVGGYWEARAKGWKDTKIPSLW